MQEECEFVRGEMRRQLPSASTRPPSAEAPVRTPLHVRAPLSSAAPLPLSSIIYHLNMVRAASLCCANFLQ